MERRDTTIQGSEQTSVYGRSMLLAVGLVGIQLLSGCNLVSNRPASRNRQRPASVQLPPLLPLPANWPPLVDLPRASCRPGAPVIRQQPGHAGPFTTGIIDGRCTAGESSWSAAAYAQPDAQSSPVAELLNGLVVRLDCQTSGRAVSDVRNDRGNDQWFGITFKDRLSNTDRQAFVSAASQGQITPPATNEVPPC